MQNGKKTAHQRRKSTAVDEKSGKHLEPDEWPKEWIAAGTPNGNGDSCVCGKKHLSYVYGVRHIHNGNTLNVGSSCLNDFGLKQLTPAGQESLRQIQASRRNIPKPALLNYLTGAGLITHTDVKRIKYGKQNKDYDLIECFNNMILDHCFTNDPRICRCGKRQIPKLGWFDRLGSPNPQVKYICNHQ